MVNVSSDDVRLVHELFCRFRLMLYSQSHVRDSTVTSNHNAAIHFPVSVVFPLGLIPKLCVYGTMLFSQQPLQPIHIRLYCGFSYLDFFFLIFSCFSISRWMGDDSIFLFVAASKMCIVRQMSSSLWRALSQFNMCEIHTERDSKSLFVLGYGKIIGIFMLIFNACVSSLCLSLALACFYNIQCTEPNRKYTLFLCISVYLFPFVVSISFFSLFSSTFWLLLLRWWCVRQTYTNEILFSMLLSRFNGQYAFGFRRW